MGSSKNILVSNFEQWKLACAITVICHIIFISWGPTPKRVLQRHISQNVNVYKATLDTLQSLGVKFPEVVLAQHVHETGWRTSAHFLRGNNCYGMKRNSRSFNVYKYGKPCDSSVCVDCVHAHYHATLDSHKDYKAWQDIRIRGYEKVTGRKINSVEDYFIFLDNLVLFTKYNKPYFARYATDKKYREKVQGALAKLEPYLVEP